MIIPYFRESDNLNQFSIYITGWCNLKEIVHYSLLNVHFKNALIRRDEKLSKKQITNKKHY